MDELVMDELVKDELVKDERPARAPKYPVNLDVDGVACLVVGGGEVAARKVTGLLGCGAAVTVVAPDAVAELREDPRVRWHRRGYRRGEVASYRLAISATGDPDVDAQVSNDARAVGVPVNVADVPALCTFTLPSVLRRGDLQIAVSSAGRSPAFASWVRNRIEANLPAHLVDVLELLAETRRGMLAAGRPTEHRGWFVALDGGLVDLVAEGRTADARSLLREALELEEAS